MACPTDRRLSFSLLGATENLLWETLIKHGVSQTDLWTFLCVCVSRNDVSFLTAVKKRSERQLIVI